MFAQARIDQAVEHARRVVGKITRRDDRLG